MGKFFGVILSPIILLHLEKFGNYGLQLGCNILAIIYTLKFIPKTPSKRTHKNIFMDYMVLPLLNMFQCLFKQRPKGVHWLIAIQVYMYTSYIFAVHVNLLRYLFMLKTFENFDSSDYAMFNMYNTLLCIVGCLVIVPILSKYFGLHDAAMLTICVGTEALGN